MIRRRVRRKGFANLCVFDHRELVSASCEWEQCEWGLPEWLSWQSPHCDGAVAKGVTEAILLALPRSHSKPNMNLIDALNWRYATKQFDPSKKVSAEDLETILVAGNLAATSYGLQPFKFVVVSDQQTQDELVPFSYNQPQVSQASHVIILAARTDVDEAFIRNMARLTEKQRDLPQGELDGYAKQMIGAVMSMSDPQRIQWAQKQIYIALANMMVACAAAGVDSCPMEGFVPAQYDRLLNLGDHKLTATVVLPIGYRADDDQQQHFAKVRNPMDQMVIHHSV